jgi:predicted CXXCH cytochrome family protein
MVCIFCHSTHIENAKAPLWNREEGAPVYTLYTSSTLQSIPGQPDGASKLCLSCHDGTIALGKVRSRSKEFNMLNTNLGKIPQGRPSNLGSDLSDDHPISFETAAAVAASPDLIHPVLGDPVQYDKDGKIQCTTCHDPHNDTYRHFLVKNNLGASICKTCHQPAGFNGLSVHDTASNTWSGQLGNPWPHSPYTTVVDNSCMNCHRSHNADGKERLLTSVEEGVCLNCHNGSVGKDIDALLNRTSSHRVEFYRGNHDPTENIMTASKHVECVDCHSPHQANNTTASAPYVNGTMKGVSGMSINGTIKSTAQYQYEVCLKCHGQDNYRITTTINRQVDTSNIRMAINPSNASYHAIAAQGTSNWVPSLIPPYTTSSRLYCTACHDSSASVKAGGSGPNGPHGSNYEYLLERRYETGDFVSYTSAKYDLCFKCHNPNILFNSGISGFEEHEKHVRGENTSCSVCHDPHGSPNHVGLINFDTNVVFPSSSGQLRFEVIGDKGYCYLNCHGENHSPQEYRRK